MSRARLRKMIEEATIDAYGESEQIVGFYTMIEDHLAVPFETTLLGMPVSVRAVDRLPAPPSLSCQLPHASPASLSTAWRVPGSIRNRSF